MYQLFLFWFLFLINPKPIIRTNFDLFFHMKCIISHRKHLEKSNLIYFPQNSVFKIHNYQIILPTPRGHFKVGFETSTSENIQEVSTFTWKCTKRRKATFLFLSLSKQLIVVTNMNLFLHLKWQTFVQTAINNKIIYIIKTKEHKLKWSVLYLFIIRQTDYDIQK